MKFPREYLESGFLEKELRLMKEELVAPEVSKQMELERRSKKAGMGGEGSSDYFPSPFQDSTSLGNRSWVCAMKLRK